jgi:hypothetical protein
VSRYTLRHDDEFEVTVGYDAPLDSFFAMVLDIKASEAGNEDVYVLWVGQEWQAIQEADAALALVAQWVPDERRERVLLPLRSDQEMGRHPV